MVSSPWVVASFCRNWTKLICIILIDRRADFDYLFDCLYRFSYIDIINSHIDFNV